MAAVTISSALWSSNLTARLGPYQDGSGNLWVVALEGTGTPRLFQSTDGGATWSNPLTSAFGLQTTIDSVFDSANGIIYVAFCVGSGSAINIVSWTLSGPTETNLYVSGTKPTLSPDSNSKIPFFITRRSTGELVVAYQGTHTVSGTPRHAVFYASLSTAGVWGASVEVSAAAVGVDYDLKCACVGASDRVHILYNALTGTGLTHRSLSSTNVFDTAAQIQGDNGGAVPSYNAYYDAALARIAVQGSGSHCYRAVSAANPLWTTDGLISGADNVAASTSNTAFVYDQTSRLYCVYRDSASADVFVTRTATTTWLTGTLQDVATATAGISAGLITNAIGIIFQDSGTVYFDKYALPIVQNPSISPLLIRLTSRRGKFIPLDGIIVPTLAGIAYTESATVASTTTITVTETTNYVESATIASSTAISTVEPAAYLDSATISSITSLSATEAIDYVETATVTSLTTITSVEFYVPFIQEPNIQPLLMGLARFRDPFRILTQQLVPGSVPSAGAAYVESATVSSVTQVLLLPTAGGATFVNVATSTNNTINVPAGVQNGDLLVMCLTDAAAADYTWAVSGWTLRITTHNGANLGLLTRIASSEPSSYTVPSLTVRAGWIAAYRGVTQEAPDVSAFGTGAVGSSLTPSQPDDLEMMVVINNDTTATTASSGFAQRVGLVSFASLAYSFMQDKLDAAAGATGTVSPVNPGSQPCYAHVMWKAQLATQPEAAQYVDSVTVASVTAVSAAEVEADVDASTIASVTTPSIVEFANYVEAATVASVTAPSITEIAAYVDAATVASVTAPTAVETTDYIEAAIVASVTSIAYIEYQVVYAVGPSIQPLLIRLALMRGVIRILSQGLVPGPIGPIGIAYSETATISSVTTPSAVETTDYVEAATVAVVTTPSSIDLTADVEVATIASVTSISVVEVSAYVDASVVATITSLTYVESVDYVDAATVVGVTSLTYTEVAGYVESATVPGSTSITSVESTDYVEVATVASVTSLPIFVLPAFPSVPVLDPFTGAAGVDPNWSILAIGGANSPLNYDGSGHGISTTSSSNVIYNVQQFGPDCSAYWTIAALAGADDVRVNLRGTPGTSATFTAYIFRIRTTGVVSFERRDPGASVTLATFPNITVVAGDKIGMSAIGTMLYGYYCPVSTGVWQLAGVYDTVNDATKITTAGYAGLSLNTATADDFGAGTLIGVTEAAVFVDTATITSRTAVTLTELYVPPAQQLSIRPLLIILRDFIGPFRLLTPTFASAFVAPGIIYTDSATVASITAVTSVETADYLDLNTVAEVTSVQLSESTDFVEAATVASVTAVSSTDIAAYVDGSTIPGVTTPSSTDVAADVDQQTVAGVTSVSYVETAAYIEAATISSVTSLTYTEIAGYSDTATTSSVTSVTAVESTDYVEVATVAGVTSVVLIEQIVAAPPTQHPLMMLLAHQYDMFKLLTNTHLVVDQAVFVSYIEAATITSVTQPSAVELANYVESATISSVTAVSITEFANYVDGTVISGTTAPSSTEVAADVESATVASVTSVSSVEIAAYVDGVTVSSTTSPSSTDITADVEAGTVASVTTPSAVEVANYVESATIATVTSLISVEIAAYADAQTVSSVTAITAVESTDYVESATVAGVTSLVVVEFIAAAPPTQHPLLIKLALFHENLRLLINSQLNITVTAGVPYTESATVSSVTTPSISDVAAYVDGTLVATATTPSQVEAVADVENATIASVTSVSYAELAGYVESATVKGVTSVSSTDVAAFVDGSTVTATTVPSITELSADTDTATVSGTTSITSVDVAAYLDAGTIVSNTTGTITEFASYSDTATTTGVTSLTAVETTDYVEVATVASTTSAFIFEVFTPQPPHLQPLLMKLGQRFKFLTNNMILRPIVQLQTYTESATVSSVTTPSLSDVANYVDSASLSSKTSLTYLELPSNTETATLQTVTAIFSSDVATYVESAVFSTVTKPSITELFGANNLEAATITSRTTVFLIEYRLPITGIHDFEYQAYRHWNLTATRAYAIHGSYGGFDVADAQRHWEVSGVYKRYLTRTAL